MSWYILSGRERLRSGRFVAVAAAHNDWTATLVRDYLRERGVGAVFPPVSYLYFPLPTRVWVHADDEDEAVRLLQELQAEWQGA
ncbi:MAG: DUF2007 domain-containing protein [Fimbriimonadales bacterium]|nr:DUF2007 domain-containing protein [Fimbriimonadales bacterium]